MGRPALVRLSPWKAGWPTRTRRWLGTLIPLLGLYQGANDQCFVKMLINFFRALGQMFDKLNSAEQVEGAESVVKVLEYITSNFLSVVIHAP